jgi:hypothetical protein
MACGGGISNCTIILHFTYLRMEEVDPVIKHGFLLVSEPFD